MRRHHVAILVCFLALVLPRPSLALTVITSTSLASNTHWGSSGVPVDTEYLLQPSSGTTLTVGSAATLTIDPGTAIRLAPGVSLVVNGSLSAIGSTPQPIVFSSNGSAGDWGGISFGSAATVSMSSCQLGGFGTYPVTGTVPQVASLFASNTFTPRADGKRDAIQIHGSTVTASVTLSRPPALFCYMLFPDESVDVGGGASPVLTIASGTLIKLSGSYLLAGQSAAGAIRAQGCVFTSAKDDTLNDTNGDAGATAPAPGDWRAIFFRANTIDGLALLDSCEVRYGGAGSTDGAINLTDSDPTVTRCTIEKNRLYGLRVEPGTTTGVGVHDNLLRDNTTYELIAPPTAMVALVPNNHYVLSADGRYNSFEIRGATITASMTLPHPPTGFCYHVTISESINVEGGGSPVLTIADGTLIKFDSSLLLAGGSAPGAIRAHGCVFTSLKDDTLNDTNGDFGASSPAPGDWRAIFFRANTIDGLALLDSCEVRYGGAGSTDGAINLTDSDPTVTRCTIEKNRLYGLRVEPGATTGVGVHDNLLRDNTTYELIAPPTAMVALVPNNHYVLSADGRYNSFEIRGATITASMTLPHPPTGFCYHLSTSENVRVEGGSSPVLTIADGTLIKFDSSYLLAGENAAGAIRAHGCVFTSVKDDTLNDTNGDFGASSPAPGDWRAIFFRANTVDGQAVLDSCEVRYAGASSTDGAVNLLDSNPTVTRCTIEKNRLYGLRVEPGATTGVGVHDNLLRDNTTYELIAPPTAMVALVPNNHYVLSADGRYNSFEIRGATITASMTLPHPPPGFCYHLTTNEDVRVEGASAPVLTLADGTLIKMSGTSYILAGENAAGAFRAHGCVFTSTKDDTLNDTNGDAKATKPAPGDWQGLYFRAVTVSAQAVLDSCEVRYGGGNSSNAAINVTTANPAITRCTIENNAGSAVRVEPGSTSGFSISNNLIRDNTSYALRAGLVVAVALYNGNQVVPRSSLVRNGLDVTPSTLTSSLTLPRLAGQSVYYFDGTTTVAAGDTLTVPSGVVFKMGAGTSLTVPGTLLTSGVVSSAPYDPIVFTSIQDDSWWGDTDGDGNSTPPAAGDWGRIELSGAGNASQVRGVVFRYGGAGSAGQLRVLNTGGAASPNVLVQDCFFDIDLATGGGIQTTASSPRISRCGFRGATTSLAVQNLTAGQDVDATGNWWGDASGPNDPSASLATLSADVATPERALACTADLNAGLGLKVTDCVRYRPWLTAIADAPVTGVHDSLRVVTRANLRGVWPNPARGVATFAIDVPAGAPAQLEVLDVSGRRVWSEQMSARMALTGRLVNWDLRDLDGARVRPGLYFVRLSQRGVVSRGSVVVLE